MRGKIKTKFKDFFSAVGSLGKKLKNSIYELKVKIHNVLHKKQKVRKIGQRKRNDIIFYCLMLVLPVTQFCIFYIGVNFNSILMSFRAYDYATNTLSLIHI